ncbi:hypothetical protein B0O80DRAFT_453153 [Mortierella sp. GBAus27b]|nr:hypothetical protein B0O80DRAFT_453153 [Mortierella sp. GBAus27b]
MHTFSFTLLLAIATMYLLSVSAMTAHDREVQLCLEQCRARADSEYDACTNVSHGPEAICASRRNSEYLGCGTFCQ